MSKSPATRGPGGRPQDRGVDRRILEAAMKLLAEEGFTRMSIEAVAAEAGVAKTTIYRRFSGKVDLVSAALNEFLAQMDPVELGSAREELVVHLQHNRERIDPAIPGSLLAEEEANPALLEVFRERVIHPRFAMIGETLRRGIERGELRSDLDTDAATQLLVGAFFAHYLHRGRPDEDWPERVVDAVWPSLAPPGA
ncbi:MAG: TetR/AcrR family transcriptional regulator [Thermoleophilaceae bacterium]